MYAPAPSSIIPTSNPWGEQLKGGKVAADGELLHIVYFEQTANIGTIRRQQRRGISHRHCLCNLGGFYAEVDTSHVPDIQLHVPNLRLFEAGEFDTYRIDTVRQKRKFVSTNRTGVDSLDDTCGLV